MHGELWRARHADEADASVLEPGSRVRVTGRRGLDLLVAPEESVKGESVNGEEEKTWKS
jgi:membrane-bound ClpP family serine protease